MGLDVRGWKSLLFSALVGVLALAGTAAASSSYRTAFRTAYPAAVGSKLDSCILCHQTTSGSPSSPRNSYGVSYAGAGHSFTAIAAVDSDGDGISNGAEIIALTFPGNGADPPTAALPTVTVAATDAVATEAGLTTGQYTLTRTGATTAALTVSYAVSGTATSGSDFTALTGSVVIAAGAATATITVTPINDVLVEADETVVVTLSATAAYTVGAAASATVAIQSDDVAVVLPTVTIAATDAVATEAGLTTGQYTLTRTGATTAALTVSYAVSGTATSGSDFTALTGSVVIAAGAATATITVTPLDDLLVEPDESVVVTISATAAYTLGTAASATVMIQSNEVTTLPTVTILATDAAATEAGLTTGQFTLTRTGATTTALTVNYTVSGTATAGGDYAVLGGSVQMPAGAATATITVTPIDDLLVEPDETVVVTLGANAAYLVGAASAATVTIQSDDVLPTATIAATDAIATEAGLTTGQYTLTRTGATTAALSVVYTVSGTATAGVDYAALAGSVQIPAGATTATITVTPINDLLVEPDESVVVTLGVNAAYVVGTPASATVTIQSDDALALPTVTIAATDQTATEAGLTTGQFTVTRTGATTEALAVSYSVAGTATAGGDYATLPGSVQIPAGSSAAAIAVTPIADAAAEPDETVVVTLAAGAAYAVGPAASATVTITAGGDFNHDGRFDILWKESQAGWLYVWYMDGLTKIGGDYLAPSQIGQDWRVAGIADFNNDGKNDILWQHATAGWLYAWYMDGLAMIGGSYLEPSRVDPAWRVAGIADFDGDGKVDILWRETTVGWLYVWRMDGLTKIGGSYLAPNMVDPAWRVAGIADFNGDGKADILWHETTVGWLYVWYMDGLTKIASSYLAPELIDPSWYLAGIADFNNDGKPDILWQGKQAGWLYVFYLDGVTKIGGDHLSPPKIETAWQVVGISEP